MQSLNPSSRRQRICQNEVLEISGRSGRQNAEVASGGARTFHGVEKDFQYRSQSTQVETRQRGVSTAMDSAIHGIRGLVSP